MQLHEIITAAGMLPVAEAAIFYAENGVKVFPCDPLNKKPLTPHGFKDATTDLAIVKEWWRIRGDALVSMPTGNGIAVIDVDTEGFENVGKLDLPRTFEVTTRSGGAHLYYNGAIRSSASKLATGVDTRGAGGYVCVPAAGTGYDVAVSIPLSPLPAAIQNAFKPQPAPVGTMLTTTGRKLAELLHSKDVDRIEESLISISPDNYDTWYQMGMAIKSYLPLSGFDIWHNWSKTDDGYVSEDDCRYHWESFGEKTAGITIASLFHLAKEEGENGEWEDIEEEEVKEKVKDPAKSTVKLSPLILDAGDWMEDPAPVLDPVIAGVINAGGKCQIVGQAKSRKSFFTLQLSIGLATGISQCGMVFPKKRTVLLIQFEVSAKSMWHRINKMCRATSIDPTKLKGQLYIVNGRGKGLTIEAVQKLAEELKPECLVLDPKYKIAVGVENAAEDAAVFQAALDLICEDIGATAFVVHHDAKGVASERQATDRGSGSGVGSRDVDAGINLSKHRTEPDAIVVESYLRDFAPKSDYPLRWSENRFVDATDLEAIVETAASVKAKKARGPDTVAMAKKVFDMLTEEPMSKKDLHAVISATFKDIGSNKVDAILATLKTLPGVKFACTHAFPMRTVYSRLYS